LGGRARGHDTVVMACPGDMTDRPGDVVAVPPAAAAMSMATAAETIRATAFGHDTAEDPLLTPAMSFPAAFRGRLARLRWPPATPSGHDLSGRQCHNP
jgi:hypothetical protein